VSSRRAALGAGAATLGLVAAASALAWRDGSPLVPSDGGLARRGTAWLFFALLVAAFTTYVLGLLAVRRSGLPVRLAFWLAVAVQLVPFFAPLLLSTDAWTYWGYGWIAAEGGGNPYVDPPSSFPESPAAPYLGAAWRDTTTVYGPAFTMLSEPVARLAGSSPDTAAWIFKGLAAAAILVATAAVARASRRPALAAAFVGWNPVLAIHAAGGGHNDALVGALVALAVALGARRRASFGGAMWALAALVKWVPLVFFALAALAARSRSRPAGIAGFIIALGAVVGAATWRYGLDWLGALRPLADNTVRRTSYALPSRLEQLGAPEGVALALALAALAAGLLWLARDALRGRAHLGRAACLVLATSPYLAVWYLAWAVPLAAPEEDRLARLGVLALTAYLLPQTIPL
jgi:Glycosyltransferase family 87